MNGLLDALKNATAEDLAAVRREIAALQGLETLLAGRIEPALSPAPSPPPTRKVEGMNGKPTGGRKTMAAKLIAAAVTPPAARNGSLDGDRRKLGEFLKLNGPKRRDALYRALDCDNAHLDKVLEHDWFEKDAGMFTLSSDGHVAFRKDDGDD